MRLDKFRIRFLVMAVVLLWLVLVTWPVWFGVVTSTIIGDPRSQENNEAALRKAMNATRRIVVFQSREPDEVKLYESTNAKDWLELKEAITLKFDGSISTCGCAGGPFFVLYSADGSELGRFNVHHHHFINSNIWTGSGNITKAEPLVKWFTSRGVLVP